MAALLGVERGSAAAPRQPALVKPSRRLLHSTTACLSAPKAELASVHRHTRKITRVSSNRMDGPSGTPRGGGSVDRTS